MEKFKSEGFILIPSFEVIEHYKAWRERLKVGP